PPAPGEPVAEVPRRVKETPTLVEMAAFFTLTAILLIAIQAIAAAVALHWRLFGRISLMKLAL
ncbi:MAG TPA: hypothetical protein VII48_04565, partial [Rhizomicrobium sp.]